MESTDTPSHDTQQTSLLHTGYVLQMISTTAKWAKFLSITGFIVCAFMVLAALGMFTLGDSLSEVQNMPGPFASGSFIGSFYLLIGAISFLMSRYLSQYAEKLNLAVQNQDETQLILALDKNKSFFKFVGVTALVIIGLYVFFFIAFIIIQVAFGGAIVTP